MQSRVVSIAILAVGACAQIAPGDEAPGDAAPGDAAPGDAAPGDFTPFEGPADETPFDLSETFADWCAVASDCISGELDASVGADVQCIQGSCSCSGAFEDAGALVSPDYAGWACVLIGDPMPSFDMSYTVQWSDAECALRPADFDATLRAELMSFFEMTTLTLSEPYCGSVHFGGSGSTSIGGKSGFGAYFASNPSNPFGAPVVSGQKSSLSSCVAVSPISTASQIAALCQPTSCIAGYTLVSSGSVDVQSACVVDASGSGSPGTPTPSGSPVVLTNSSDDGISVGAAMGISFGIALLFIFAFLAIFMNKRKSTSVAHHDEDIAINEIDSEQQQNNGPDMEGHQQEDNMVV